jgi:hypothetical protein
MTIPTPRRQRCSGVCSGSRSQARRGFLRTEAGLRSSTLLQFASSHGGRSGLPIAPGRCTVRAICCVFETAGPVQNRTGGRPKVSRMNHPTSFSISKLWTIRVLTLGFTQRSQSGKLGVPSRLVGTIHRSERSGLPPAVHKMSRGEGALKRELFAMCQLVRAQLTSGAG